MLTLIINQFKGLGSTASTSCITISEGDWIQSHTLLSPRFGHVSFPLNDGIVLMGGWDANSRLTSEIVKFNGKVEKSFSLKYGTL